MIAGTVNAIRKINGGLALAIGIPVIFSITYLVSYSPLTEGWWHVYSAWIQLGKVPYRDFELLVPPLYPYVLALLDQIGLESFLSLRLVGLIFIAAIGAMVFFLIRNSIDKYSAGLIAGTAATYLQMGSAFINYDYVYLAIIFTLATFLPIASTFNSRDFTPEKQQFWNAAVSGLFAGLALVTKQSNGLVSIFFGLLLWLVFTKFSTQGQLRTQICKLFEVGLTFLAGCSLPLAVLLASLIVNNSLSAFVSQVFDGAILVKGGLGVALFRWLSQLFTLEFIQHSVMVLVSPVVGLLILRAMHKRFVGQVNNLARGIIKLLYIASLLIATIVGSLYWEEVAKYLSTLNFLPVILVVLVIALNAFSPNRSPSLLPAAFGAIALVWASGMSAGLAQTAMFLAVASSVTFFLSFVEKKAISQSIALLVCISLGVSFYSSKTNEVFNWWGLATAPISEAKETFSEGLQTGLRANSSEVTFSRQIATALEKAKSCPGEIVAFPHVPVFLLNSKLLPQGQLATYWFDFASQRGVKQEIMRLENRNISALVFVEVPESVMASHENLFAQGQRYAQRELAALLLSKVKAEQPDSSLYLSNGYILHLYTNKCKVG